MIHFKNHLLRSDLKWVFFNFAKTNFESSKIAFWASGSCQIVKNPRFYGKRKSDRNEDVPLIKVSRGRRKEAQTALLEYLHSTRSMQFRDAENMSMNSPRFLENILKKFTNDENIGKSITRFLRYHPINEFEPFFESIGLSPSEYSSFLPRNVFFLNDDKLLLENYYVLCNYGIVRNKIGKIYKEATEVFRHDCEILQAKLKSFEELGFDKSTVSDIVVSNPYLLLDNIHRDFLIAVEKLKTLDIECGWIEEHMLKGDTYNWRHVYELLCLLRKMGCSKMQLREILSQASRLIFECSGRTATSLISFILKFGVTSSQIIDMFLHFPQSDLGIYARNMRQSYHFLVESELNGQEIGKIMRTHPLLLGSCNLKKVDSLLVCLNIGKARLREIITKDPQVLKSWVMGSRVKPLNIQKESPQKQKAKFLLDLGYIENSPEMKKAFKAFRGKAGELQERFNYLVDAGFDRKDLLEMLKLAPQILNMSKNMLEMKIDFLVNGLGHPVSSLIAFPAYVSYTIQRVNLRFSMYNWLVAEGTAEPNLALSTIIACSDMAFIKQYVEQHPEGLEMWDKFKKDIYSD
ncbi:transcription termination factor MTEF18, mitochondrial-like [Apium graveolens]|uniref:transcription termination factor MTEF18, mitochondrial-like n=1 Tax=Apium graveolens TaxID=4045 RepID=UPI003D795622